MKAKVASLLVVLLLTTTQCMAQKKITVEAESYDISNNLDLQAVASVFGESDNLQEFEMKLNDFDSKISNLDLNNDGEVDYLRVIETSENNVHVVVVQAVLDRELFQDVATIVVEKNRNRRTYVQVIGDPYIYGTNYIIEPVYVYTPHIFSFFWSTHYSTWHSPYYWGYYPSYYRNRNPYEVNIYLSHVNRHVNHDHRYYYTERYRNDYAIKLHNRVSRNDYGNKYPDRTFSDRNKDVRNKQEYDNKRIGGERGITTRPNYQGSEAGRRGYENTTRTSTERNENRNSTINNPRNEGSRSAGSGVNERMTQPRTSTPSTAPRTYDSNRNQREATQSQSSTNVNSGSRNYNNVERRDNSSRNSNPASTNQSNTRSTPTVVQPSSRSSESKSAERTSSDRRSSGSQSERGSRSSDNNSNRR